ncbi:protein RMD5 homolog A [Eurytemora carolleeae]|uniref:protein RMD5 homolog A n=1 Tax=Eurytemora carolleeae TaxID=1294199 RepID=UPI000C7829D4|nr:protein RMD5 homolog A [Eurytemora carolleeae]|eukprot:XP_023338857.1 protein RMD5 homolog A-like [Eurytemora affinis]
MDACSAVGREADKVLSKFSNLGKTINKSIDDQISQIEALRAVLATGEDEQLTSVHKTDLKHLTLKISDGIGRIATEHRDLHSTVSKVGKAIDRNFVSDFDSTSREDVLRGPNKEHLLNEVILQHLYRQGHLTIAQTLAEESGVHEYKSQKEPFLALNNILGALKERNLEPALNWAAENRDALNLQGSSIFFSQTDGRATVQQKSSLELRLHKLKFVDLLNSGDRMQAILYARRNFPNFVQGQEKEIQVLMGAVMYAGPDLKSSPYSSLLDPCHWAEIEDMFLRDACALMGLSVESPLAVAINAGCTALPALLNIKQVMQQRQVAGVWNAKDELPIEIDLPENMRFHSVFACPILRQQVSEGNPPMRLTCGHVISRDALNKLTTGHKLKCPYCPIEQNPVDARIIYF